jgi:hypothetical protein
VVELSGGFAAPWVMKMAGAAGSGVLAIRSQWVGDRRGQTPALA